MISRPFLVSVLLLLSVASARLGFDGCWQHLYRNVTPATPDSAFVFLCREGFLGICYDIEMTNPLWSVYMVTKENTSNFVPGRLNFRRDPDLFQAGITQARNGDVVWSRYWNRGHLAPSRIMSYSKEAKQSTYYYSNVAPQWGQFNQQPWERMESAVFTWLRDSANGTELYLITGVSYRDRARAHFNETIAVPDFYFSVICDSTNHESVGFYGKNEHDGGGLVLVYRTVREIEIEVFGLGRLIDPMCRTDRINATHWNFGYPESQYIVPQPDGADDSSKFSIIAVFLLFPIFFNV